MAEQEPISDQGVDETGPAALTRMMADHYRRLSVAFREKGMSMEARMFSEVVSEFEELGKKFRDSLARENKT